MCKEGVLTFKTGDLVRSRYLDRDKGLVIGLHADGTTPKVLWLTGLREGEWTWENPCGYLDKMEVESA
tara:strand:+ start:471 stop:674 length:204 start_codon:yes stop_codon:yes gene_type:complete